MNLRTEAPGTITTRPGANPISKLYRIKLRYVGFEHSDWLINSFNQSEGLKPAFHNFMREIIFIESAPGLVVMGGVSCPRGCK